MAKNNVKLIRIRRLHINSWSRLHQLCIANKEKKTWTKYGSPIIELTIVPLESGYNIYSSQQVKTKCTYFS